jgi:ABC-type bacteriocin/lantibiotic exporter with double-glycine peptidase domain
LRAQRKGYWCGIASIANALEVLGIKRSQREIAKLCHVTEAAGTNETEMQRALLANGVQIDVNGEVVAQWALSWLDQHLTERGPVILCVDNDEHWVTVIGTCGDRFIIFDPSRNSGIEVHDATSLAARWVNSDGVYYGIGVTK